ncbi:MAG TPA: twin-arginine translocase TatA/TatE family subunit [Acidimicrobiia bacterium]|nr:twin-arginine translocase TatA/TatE family subunit [Acidimicrobiia bacterium]
MDLGAPELLIILVIGLLIFGSNKLPKLARSLGQASKEFKSAANGWSEPVTAPEPVVSPPVVTPAPEPPAEGPPPPSGT